MSKLDLPPDFIRTIQNTFGEDGKQFISDLPALIGEVSQRWALTDIQTVTNLSYNFVAFARRSNEEVVLKMGVPNRELTSEMAALRLFDGEGACRLVDCDEERGFILLERLNPGVMLATMKNDDEATHIAAAVMKRIWRPDLDTADEHRLLDQRKFIQLSDWFNGFKRMHARFAGGTGPLAGDLVERAEKIAEDFFAEDYIPVLLHGDLHHFNVLSSGRGWLVIDPKGVIGPAGYEVGPFMMNPWGSISDRNSFQITRSVKRRVDILHEHLGFERERIINWSLAHAILSAWWGIEDHTGWEYSLAFAEMIADLK